MSKKETVFEYIKNYLLRNAGRSPSLDEIMLACNIPSKSHAKIIVDKIVAIGLLQKSGGARGLHLPNSRLVEDV